MSQSFLITLTAPSAAGKSYLLNYIRDEMKLPCLISTTTRAKRANEVEGVDYFFISRAESEAMEARGEFAELAIFGGHRYGVSKTEFSNKLNDPVGLAFLIVEPAGIDHYVAPALEVGAVHLKFFVDVPLDVRLERIQERTVKDIEKFSEFFGHNYPKATRDHAKMQLENAISTYTTRLTSVLGKELAWKTMHEWDAILDGQLHPGDNLNTILEVVRQARLKYQ